MIQKDLNIQLGKMLGLSIKKTAKPAVPAMAGSFWGFLIKNLNSTNAGIKNQPQTLKLTGEKVSLSLQKQDKLSFSLGRELEVFRNKIKGLNTKERKKLAELDDQQLAAVWLTGKALESVALQPGQVQKGSDMKEVNAVAPDTTIIQFADLSGQSRQITVLSGKDKELQLSGDSELLKPFKNAPVLMQTLFPALKEQKILFGAGNSFKANPLTESVENSGQTGADAAAGLLEKIEPALKEAFNTLAKSDHPGQKEKLLYADDRLKVEVSKGVIIVETAGLTTGKDQDFSDGAAAKIKGLLPGALKTWPLEIKQRAAKNEDVPIKEALTKFAKNIKPGDVPTQKIYSSDKLDVEAQSGKLILKPVAEISPAAQQKIISEVRGMLTGELKTWPLEIQKPAIAPATQKARQVINEFEQPLKNAFKTLAENPKPTVEQQNVLQTAHLKVQANDGKISVSLNETFTPPAHREIAEGFKKLLPPELKNWSIQVKTAPVADNTPPVNTVPGRAIPTEAAKNNSVHVLSFQVQALNTGSQKTNKAAAATPKAYEVRLVSEHIEIKPLTTGDAKPAPEKQNSAKQGGGKGLAQVASDFSSATRQATTDGFNSQQQAAGDSWKGFTARKETASGRHKVHENKAPVSVFAKEMQVQEVAVSEKVKVAQTVQKIVEVIENYKRLNKTASEVRMMIQTEKTGEMEVRVRDGRQASLIMMVENETIRQEVIRLLPQIQESLDDKGLSFGAVQVDVGQSRDGEKGEGGEKHAGGSVGQKQEEKNEDIASKKPQQKRYGYNTMEVIA